MKGLIKTPLMLDPLPMSHLLLLPRETLRKWKGCSGWLSCPWAWSVAWDNLCAAQVLMWCFGSHERSLGLGVASLPHTWPPRYTATAQTLLSGTKLSPWPDSWPLPVAQLWRDPLSWHCFVFAQLECLNPIWRRGRLWYPPTQLWEGPQETRKKTQLITPHCYPE